jgi:hypothetical protein
MTWVRANRPRLVAACLTLCQAWIAAGKPRVSRTIGSYENWAQIIGGVLEVAGIPDFLGNLDEMMEASDSEGAVWRSFVSAWWDRFGTAEVGTGDLFSLATDCEPLLPLGSGNEKSQRTRLGKALGKMRDRVFDIARTKVRLRLLGVSHQAKRWQLTVEGERGERYPDLSEAQKGERWVTEGNVEIKRSPAYPIENTGSGERGERGERFSNPYAYADAPAPAHMREDSRKRSPRSPRSLSPDNSTGYAGEGLGEGLRTPAQRSPIPNPPAWLEDVP